MDPISVVNRWFYSRDIERIFGITNRQLQYWDETGFFKPTQKSARRRKYSFMDLIQLKVIHDLLQKGISLRKIRQSVNNLEHILPSVTFPFLELQIATDGESIFIHHKNSWFEAHTGQHMISFRVEDLYSNVVNALSGQQGGQPAEGERGRRRKEMAEV